MTFLDFALANPFGVAFGLVLAVMILAIVWAIIAADAEGR